MSVKHAMLALLSADPSTAYQLKKRFDATTGQSWPLNIGQVSTTLQRLERDGQVARDGDEAGSLWTLTSSGRVELAEWWSTPVLSEQRGRDELVVKFAVSTVSPHVDIAELIQTQRAATQRAMHDLTRLRRGIDAENDATAGLTAKLIIDHHLFIAEAELRWLDDIEMSLVKARRSGAAAFAAPTETIAADSAASEGPAAPADPDTPATDLVAPTRDKAPAVAQSTHGERNAR